VKIGEIVNNGGGECLKGVWKYQYHQKWRNMKNNNDNKIKQWKMKKSESVMWK